ncbi:MAG: rod-binding protein [Vicinamibacterales bacterium]
MPRRRPGASIMGDTMTNELAQALGKTGSLGIADMMASALSRRRRRGRHHRLPST